MLTLVNLALNNAARSYISQLFTERSSRSDQGLDVLTEYQFTGQTQKS